MPEPAALLPIAIPAAIALLIGVIVARKVSLFAGVGAASAISFLAPTWVNVETLAIDWDARLCVALVTGAVVLLGRTRSLFSRLVPLDLLVGFMAVWQVASEWHAGGEVVEVGFLAYGHWILPYVIGRCVARSLGDLRVVGLFVAAVGVLLGLAALLETTSGFDIYEAFFGERPGMQFRPAKLRRWGYPRAEGPYDHPIFLGIITLLLLPWTLWLARYERGEARIAVAAAVVAMLLGLLCTISRGPIGGLAILLLVAAGMRYRWLGYTLLAVTAAGIVALLVRPSLPEDLARQVADASEERVELKVIDGEEVVSSSVVGRLVIVRGYAKALRKAGPLGYGTTATSQFPPDIPHVPVDELTGEPVSVVDNSYVYYTLRGGWVMGVGYLLLHLAGFFRLRKVANWDGDAFFCRLLAGAIVAHAVVSFTVYPAYDYIYLFLWTLGVAAAPLGATYVTQSD